MIGRTISHYTILERLGGGGMGIVYKAEDTRLGRTVALKFLPPGTAPDTRSRDRFLREAQAASALDHPNICPVFDLAETSDGEWFMVMPCYEGETLRQMLDRGPLPAVQAVDVAIQMATGLAEAHRCGIIHRDITPSNVLVTPGGQVKILDFGLAWLTGRERLTHSGQTVGTLAYMSPETLAGGAIDRRTDIWAFGVTLYEMLSGHLPFRGDHPESMMYEIMYREPEELGAAGVSDEVRELCRRCLQKKPRDRPDSMDDILAILGAPRTRGRSLFTRLRQTPVSRIATFTVLIAGVAAVLLLLRPQDRLALPTRSRVAILPFRNLSGDSSLAPIIRDGQALFAAELIGVEWLGIVDPLSLNGLLESSVGAVEPPRTADVCRLLHGKQVDFVIDASVTRSTGGLRLQTDVIDPSREPSEVAFSSSEAAASDGDLAPAIGTIAGRVLDFLEVRLLHENPEREIRPWLAHRKSSPAALKAFSRAWESMFRADYADAGRNLQRAISLDSQFVSPRVWLIPALVAAGQTRDAEAQYRYLQSLEIHASPFERVMIAWAGACLRNDLARQTACLEEALEYSPGSNLLLGNIAHNRYRMHDVEGALRALAPCLESRWRYPPLYPLAGVCFISAGRFDEARSALEEGMTLPHTDPRTFSLLSALSCRTADTASTRMYAATFFRMLRERGDPPGAAPALLGDHLLLVGMPGAAAVRYAEAVDLAADSIIFRQKLAGALLDADRVPEALRETKRGLARFPESPLLHYLAARIYDRMGDTTSALSHYRICADASSPTIDTAHVRLRLHALQR